MPPHSHNWQSISGCPALHNDEVHIWRIPLVLVEETFAQARRLLAPEECSRADRFHFEKDRVHFIAARSAMRRILGLYTTLPPEKLLFSYSVHGKPDLVVESGADLQFNLSHSHELALLAVTRQRPIGVDIEYIRPNVMGEKIAERFFSKREVEMLNRLPARLQPIAFFNCWTRKEAYIKALGKGLSYPLEKFAVSLAPEESARLLWIENAPEEPKRWKLEELHPGSGYAGAVIAPSSDWTLKCFHWSGN